METWQKEVLGSENLRVDQDENTGYKLVIRRTDRENRMGIHEIVAAIRQTKRKPVIMCPDDPFRGMYAERREVLEELMSSNEYEEYLVMLAEARMCGVI